jgi:tRNA (guanosine-2'-O-)-methyltransferase
MTQERRGKIRAVLDRRQPDLTVFLENVHKPHNLSAILRSCDAVGVLEAHCVSFGTRPRAFSDTSAGSEKWVPLHQYETTRGALESLKAQGFQIAAAHLSDEAIDYRELDYTRPTAILLGAEKFGVTDEAALLVDKHVIIPMHGMVQSLNVSVAAAVILFEAQRQRLEAGFYAQPRLAPETYSRLEYEWLHPREAEHFRERGEAYPALEAYVG